MKCTKTDGEDKTWFINHYECPNCHHLWDSEWFCGCDDECPECGDPDISPYQSDEVKKPFHFESDRVTIDIKNNVLISNFAEGCNRTEDAEAIAMIDGFESLLLAQWCAGVDLDTPQMREAILTSIDAITNACF